MTNVTCGLTAKKPGPAACPTLIIKYGTGQWWSSAGKVTACQDLNPVTYELRVWCPTNSVATTACIGTATLFKALLGDLTVNSNPGKFALNGRILSWEDLWVLVSGCRWSLKVFKSAEFKRCKFKASKLLEHDLLLLENFYWLKVLLNISPHYCEFW